MKEKYIALDGLRGLTALYVMIHHARLALTQSYQNGLALHPEKYDWYDKAMVYFFSLFKFGHEAVIIFFVLSGFVIHLKQSSKYYNFNNFNTLNYLKKRIIRIYPTLLVSFLLCIILDYFSHLIIKETLISVFSKYNYKDFLYNLFLIPDAPIWGNNFPMWSLKHEWFFYLLYPLLLWITSKHWAAALAIIVTFYLTYTIGLRIPYIGAAAYTLLVWSLGCLLAGIYKNTNLIKFIPYLLLLSLIYPFLNKVNQFYPLTDVTFGFIVMGCLSIIIAFKRNFFHAFLEKFAWLGTFSYSIYLLHSPFLNLYQKVILSYQPNHNLPYHLWFVLISIVVTLPIIYLIYYCSERLAINYKTKNLN